LLPGKAAEIALTIFVTAGSGRPPAPPPSSWPVTQPATATDRATVQSAIRACSPTMRLICISPFAAKSFASNRRVQSAKAKPQPDKRHIHDSGYNLWGKDCPSPSPVIAETRQGTSKPASSNAFGWSRRAALREKPPTPSWRLSRTSPRSASLNSVERAGTPMRLRDMPAEDHSRDCPARCSAPESRLQSSSSQLSFGQPSFSQLSFSQLSRTGRRGGRRGAGACSPCRGRTAAVRRGRPAWREG
jgi:hypothetical protein